MDWTDFINNANKDEADENAIERYNEWIKLTDDETITRIDMVNRGLDPDFLNEFCFYPIEKWDRLITFAKTFEKEEEEITFEEKIYRATLLNNKLDPDGIEGEDEETIAKRENDLQNEILTEDVEQIPVSSWWFGNTILRAYNIAMDGSENDTPIEDFSFKFNSIISAVIARNDKDIKNNAFVRKAVCLQDNLDEAIEDEHKKKKILDILNF